MTVCIAAICSFGTWPNVGYMVVGASDRMLSGEDIQFEPPQLKIYSFSHVSRVSAIALVAGDPYAQMSICNSTAEFIRTAKRPPTTVEEVAAIYAERFSAHRRSIAETAILKPHGLDANALLDRQQDLRGDVVADLMRRMEDRKLAVETIITGCDSTGAHIFVVTDPGQVECFDSQAFASIGSGKQHAESQFMLARHTRDVPWPQGLLSTYIAKKRAEVTPTVGRLATDLFFVDVSTGYQLISFEIHDRIRAVYDGLELRIAAETNLAHLDAQHELTAIVNRPPPQPAPPTGTPSPPQQAETASKGADPSSQTSEAHPAPTPKPKKSRGKIPKTPGAEAPKVDPES